jgi:A118 family predicted phage portal protein
MSIIAKMKGWFKTLLVSKTKDEFHIEPVCSAEVDEWVGECVHIYQGNPCWLDEEDHIDTVNFAKTLCSETSRLAMLGTGIRIDGSPRAEWLQAQIDNLYYQLRHWVEYGCAYGTVILKPNGAGIDLYKPGEFEITHHQDGKVDGVVFTDSVEVGDKWYTKLEYHRFLDSGLYAIDNHCFVGASRNSTDERIDIKLTPWADMEEEVTISYPHTLFAVLRTPGANNIDLDSPAGLPIFSEAIQELRDLDIAYSRNSEEITDSRRTVLLDSDALIATGTKVSNTAAGFEMRRRDLKLPRYVRNVKGDGQEEDLYLRVSRGSGFGCLSS